MSQAHEAKERSELAEIGFWTYLMTDIMLFASLFATFMILRQATNGGPGGHELFDIGYALAETFILLASSLTCGLALISLRFKKRGQTLLFLAATIALGCYFLGLEIHEFSQLIGEGHGPGASAFLSAFFTLVGTHGFHIFVGLIWGVCLAVLIWKRGFNSGVLRRFSLFALFWHFLDLVWIFIFTVVYIIGGRL